VRRYFRLIATVAVSVVALAGPVGSRVLAEPPDQTVIYTTSFDGGVGAEWGSLAGSFCAYDSDGNTNPDALQQTGGEACTLVHLSEQGCVPTAQGLPWSGEYLNDYEVIMHGKGLGDDADIGVAVRGNSGSALTFQFINHSFQVLKANAGGSGGGSWSFGVNFGPATSFIPGFDVTHSHEYKVRAVDGDFEFRVDGVLIGTQTDPVVGGRTFDNSSTGTVGVAGWDPIVIFDFQVKFIAGGEPLPPEPSPKGQIVLRQNAHDCADFYLYVPSGATAGTPLPLVITSHSTVTTADEEIGLNCPPPWGCCEESPFPNTRWYQLAENVGDVNGHGQQFIAAAPAMAGANGGLVLPWTGETQAATDEQRILAIYNQIVNYEATTYGFAVKTACVFLTGWSGGGIPTYYTGVRHPETFRMILSRQGNFDEDMFDTAGPLDTDLTVAILGGINDLVVPINPIHNNAREWLISHGYPRAFAAPADPHIRALPDNEWPTVPSDHYCHSLVAWDTFMDLCPDCIDVVPPQIAPPLPDPDAAITDTEYHKQLTLLQGSQPMTWSILEGPPGAQIDNQGQVYDWTPHVQDLGCWVTFEVKASNGAGFDTATWQVVVFSKADLDRDHDVDQEDFGTLQACLAGSGTPYQAECESSDVDADEDVDQVDLAIFRACMGGPNNAPGC